MLVAPHYGSADGQLTVTGSVLWSCLNASVHTSGLAHVTRRSGECGCFERMFDSGVSRTSRGAQVSAGVSKEYFTQMYSGGSQMLVLYVSEYI